MLSKVKVFVLLGRENWGLEGRGFRIDWVFFMQILSMNIDFIEIGSLVMVHVLD